MIYDVWSAGFSCTRAAAFMSLHALIAKAIAFGILWICMALIARAAAFMFQPRITVGFMMRCSSSAARMFQPESYNFLFYFIVYICI